MELLVVLAIIGITVSLIPGFMLQGDRSASLDRATSALAEQLRETRGQAVLENREALFAIDVERGLFRGDHAAAPVQIGSDIALGLVTARSERSGDASGRIRFFPDGSATGGRIMLSVEGDRRSVEVDWLTGAVSVRRDDP